MSGFFTHRSRKRRTSNSQDDFKEDQMNECTAALVLMSLSCSPNSSLNGKYILRMYYRVFVCSICYFFTYDSEFDFDFSVLKFPITNPCNNDAYFFTRRYSTF